MKEGMGDALKVSDGGEGGLRSAKRSVGACRRPGVDEEGSLADVCLEDVGVAKDQNVCAHLPGLRVEGGGVAPGDDLVAVDQAELVLAVGDGLAQWPGPYLDVKVGPRRCLRCRNPPGRRARRCTRIAGTRRCRACTGCPCRGSAGCALGSGKINLARAATYHQFLELLGQLRRPVGDVEVAYH